MKLEALMTLHIASQPVEVRTGPQGTRTVFNVTGETFHGSRLRGTVLPSGDRDRWTTSAIPKRRQQCGAAHAGYC